MSKELNREVYNSRKISANDIVEKYCLNKTIVTEHGLKIHVNEKVARHICIGAGTTLLLDEGYGNPVFIIDVLEKIDGESDWLWERVSLEYMV